MDLYVRRRPPSAGGPPRHPMTGIKELAVIMQQRGNKRSVNAEIRQRASRQERVKAGRVMPMEVDSVIPEAIDEEFWDEL